MKIILLAFLVALLALGKQKEPKKSKQLEPKKTIITFTVQEDVQQEKQIINLSLKLSKSDPSLVDAIEKAKQLQTKIRDIFYLFCMNWNELLYPQRTNDDCEKQISSNEYKIEAQYYHLRGDQLFKTFNVNFEMVLKVRQAHYIGDLIDQLSDMIDDGNIIMSGISWEDSIQQTSAEQLIDEGVSKAKLACKNINMQLHRIKSVQIWQKPQKQQKQQAKPPPEEGEEEQEQEEQEQQQKNQIQEDKKQGHKYKFVVVCKSYPSKKKTLFKSLQAKKSKKTIKSI